MRNFTRLLLFSFILFSCSKQNATPGGNTGGVAGSTPVKPVAPVTAVTILINNTAMNITSLSFERYGSGMGGGVTITASNSVQKVKAEAFNFYQQNPWGMIYQEQVSYFTRADSLQDWGAGYTRPVPRDDEVRFDNFTPLSDSVVNGSFSGSFNSPDYISREGQSIIIKGNFKLVFIK